MCISRGDAGVVGVADLDETREMTPACAGLDVAPAAEKTAPRDGCGVEPGCEVPKRSFFIAVRCRHKPHAVDHSSRLESHTASALMNTELKPALWPVSGLATKPLHPIGPRGYPTHRAVV